MDSFSLHPQLAQDTRFICDGRICSFLRMNDRQYPWLILVPRRPNISEIIDLLPDEEALLWQDVRRAALCLRHFVKPDKINIASLGNMVPQLHIHVIGRFTHDPAWPKPVWGARPARPFSNADWPTELQSLKLWMDTM